MSNVAAMKPLPKWEQPPTHPVANDMPMMLAAELAELARDIEKHGLQEPIILWRDNREAANGATGPFPIYLLDGRNRLAALKLINITDPTKAKPGNVVFTTVRTLEAVKQVSSLGSNGPGATAWVTDCDPHAFHLSMNVYRRHLTAEQRRWEIKKKIMADPLASDREIARQTKTSPSTVGAARAEIGVHFVQSGQDEHLPIERAKKAFCDNPALSARQLQAKARVSAGTAVKARKELQAASDLPTARVSKKPTEPKAKKSSSRKQSTSTQAAEEFVDFIVTAAKPRQLAKIVMWLRRPRTIRIAAKLLAARLREEKR
jgi:DNA-binding transcriptional regulator YhcF (GntR family)